MRKSSLDAGRISPVSVPISSELIASISQRYFATFSFLNFYRRMVETTPNQERRWPLCCLELEHLNRPSKLPPLFKSESWTVENSLRKLATNGLLDKNLLTLTPHILTFTANHYLVSSVEGECSNSTRCRTLRSSKGSITALDRGKLNFSAFAY